jgi:ribosomal protein S18 acetylase RimI-like enzyme
VSESARDLIELRTFRPDDCEALISWFATEAELRQFAGPGPRWPLDHAQLEQRMHEPGVHAWTARRPWEPKAIGHIERIRTEEIDRIDRVAIAPEHRGRGLAVPLVRAALDQLPIVRPVDLLVFAGNSPAIRTYEAVGFVDAGAIAPEFPDVRRMVLDPGSGGR